MQFRLKFPKKIKNNEAWPKFIGSYKKSVCLNRTTLITDYSTIIRYHSPKCNQDLDILIQKYLGGIFNTLWSIGSDLECRLFKHANGRNIVG